MSILICVSTEKFIINSMINNKIWVGGESVDDLDQLKKVILAKRLKTDQSESDFLTPKFVLADPFLLPDMDKAVKRIARAIENKEKVLIYGDYDVDGVTSLALIYELLVWRGIVPEVYIPDRLSEGYGLKYSVLKRFFDEGVDLVITVDGGIREVEVSKKILAEGRELIITDHHEPGRNIPEAVAVINPKISANRYPHRDLAGVGVAYALARALMQYMKINQREQERWLKWNLDLVALGTIADMVPLLGENRVLVKYGLIVLSKSRRQGLQYLIDLAGIDRATMTSRDVSFGLAPRINATGRMDDANHSFNLLVEKGSLEAGVLAKNIEQKNRERKELTESIWKVVLTRLDENNLPDCIVLFDSNWSKGVLGLIAAKTIRQFNRPTIIATRDSEGRIVGSARSIDGLNIVKLLEENRQYLQQFGGHEKAAGLTVEQNQWDEFVKKFSQDVEKMSLGENFFPKIIIDAGIEFDLIDNQLMQILSELHPYGMENEEPVFLSKRCRVQGKKLIGNNQNHLKINLASNSRVVLEGIVWGESEWYDELAEGDIIDVAYHLRKNSWQGRENYLLNILDIKKNEP